MADFVTVSVPELDFKKTNDLKDYLIKRARAGTYTNAFEVLGPSGWTEVECGQLQVLIARFKLGKFNL